MTTIQGKVPEVAGRRVECTLPAFEKRCLVLLETERRKDAPDQALIALLCDAVRLSREYADFIKDQVKKRGSERAAGP